VNSNQRDTWNLGWYPASVANYAVAHRPASNPITLVIIHVAQGSFTSVINLFQNPSANVSSHYIVRSSDGFIAQSVREQDIARHAGNPSYNQTSIGVEHEGYVDDPTSLTDAMYRSSAKLVASLVYKYGILVDRRHIIGHDEVPHPRKPGQYGGVSGHRDPGLYFDWEKYMGYIYAFLDGPPHSP